MSSSPWTAPDGAGDGARPDNAPGPGAPAGHAPYAPPGGGAPPGPGGAPPGGPQRVIAPRVGIIPLRPLGVGDVLGGAFRALRVRPGIMFTVAALVLGGATLLGTLFSGGPVAAYMAETATLAENPTGELSTSTVLNFVLSSWANGFLIAIAGQAVTAPLCLVVMRAIVEEPINRAETWAALRRRLGRIVLLAVVTSLAPMLLAGAVIALSSLPLILTAVLGSGDIGIAGPLLLVLGLLLAVVAYLYLWTKWILSVPALMLEDIGVGAALRRSWRLTRGPRRFWPVLGLWVLAYLIVYIAATLLTTVPGILGTVAYVAILIASEFQAITAASVVLVITMQLAIFLSYLVIYPFLAGVITILYSNQRMTWEAWDVELVRRVTERRSGPR